MENNTLLRQLDNKIGRKLPVPQNVSFAQVSLYTKRVSSFKLASQNFNKYKYLQYNGEVVKNV